MAQENKLRMRKCPTLLAMFTGIFSLGIKLLRHLPAKFN